MWLPVSLAHKFKCYEQTGVVAKITNYDGGEYNYEIIGATTKKFDRQILKYGVYLGAETLVTAGSKEITIYNIHQADVNIVEKEGLR